MQSRLAPARRLTPCAQRLYNIMLNNDVVPADSAYCFFFTVAIAAEDVRGAGDVLAAALAHNRLQPGRDSPRIVSAMSEVVRRACAVG